MNAPRVSQAHVPSLEEDTCSEMFRVSAIGEEFEESEVVQETVRTYAKQIPKSPLQHNFNAASGNTIFAVCASKRKQSPSSQSLKQRNSITVSSTPLDPAVIPTFTTNIITPTAAASSAKFHFEKENQIPDMFDDATDEQSIMSNHANSNHNSNHHNINTVTSPTTMNKQNSFQRCTTMMQRVIPAKSNSIASKEVLTTQSERSFNSANSSSIYSTTLPSSTNYDECAKGHSGQISLSSIAPKRSILSSISEISTRLVKRSKSIINATFLNRVNRCRCDIAFSAESKTCCSQAITWLKRHYKVFDLRKMKAQYDTLLTMTDIYSTHKAQIDRDVSRTFPNEGLFAENQPLSQPLKNVLYAFSIYDLQIGYVQGMNSIVAAMLYHAEEYIAFWLTCMLFESLEMRDIYLPGFPGLKKHVNITEFLMWKHIPFLHDIFVINSIIHILSLNSLNYDNCRIELNKINTIMISLYINKMDNEIEVELFSQSWILSLCGNLLPLEMMTEFIDAMLEQGWSFFYRFVITFVLLHEEAILTAEDPHDVLVLLTSSSYQSKQLDELIVPKSLPFQSSMQSTQMQSLIQEPNARTESSIPPIRWSQLIQTAKNINLNDAVVLDLLDKFDPENKNFSMN